MAESILKGLDGLLGISVVGWILVALVYVPLTALLVALARSRWRQRKTAAVIAAVVIYLPLTAGVAEAVYVDQRFKALCATAGLKINRTVVVEGFFFNSKGEYGWEDSLKTGKRGFRFVEWAEKPLGTHLNDPTRKYWRSELIAPGQVERRSIERPTARYEYRRPDFPAPNGHLMERLESTIVDRTNGEAIASHVLGYRYHAFVDRLWIQFLDGGPQMCGERGTITDALIGVDTLEKHNMLGLMFILDAHASTWRDHQQRVALAATDRP